MKQRTALEETVRRGKSDPACKMYGGFAVARLSTSELDYFPAGQPPHLAGEPDRNAEILAKYRWNGQRWSRVA